MKSRSRYEITVNVDNRMVAIEIFDALRKEGMLVLNTIPKDDAHFKSLIELHLGLCSEQILKRETNNESTLQTDH
jgi:hypothetical protein